MTIKRIKKLVKRITKKAVKKTTSKKVCETMTPEEIYDGLGKKEKRKQRASLGL